jgi:hypothetical protein
MLSNGYVKLPRSLQEHPYWPGKKFTKGEAMVDLYFLRSFAPHEVQTGGDFIFLDEGDFVASIRFLAKRWGWSLRKVASFLARLEDDKFLVKKRNGLGNGSPSVYHIADKDSYMQKDTSEGNGSGNAQDTVGIRSGYKDKKGKKGKKGNTGCAVAFDDFLSRFSPDDQDLIRQTLSAIAATPKSRISTKAAKNGLASKLAQYPQITVVTACRAYLDQDRASQGKNEKYLLGITRSIARNSEGNQNARTTQSTQVTEGGRALEKAMADLRQEQKNAISE